MSAPAVEKCVNETMYSLPLTMYGVIRGTVGIACPLTRTGTCQARVPLLALNAWIIPTPFGYCDVATVRPINARPLAVVVTGLEHGAAFPCAKPPVVTSSCFQTILFVAGSNASKRAIESAFGGIEIRSWMMPRTLLTTGCWSAAGGACTALLDTDMQTISVPVCGSKEGSGHSTPPAPKKGANTVYCLSS